MLSLSVFWFVMGWRRAKLIFLDIHRLKLCLRLLIERIKHHTFAKKENKYFHCLHLECLVVSVHDRLLTRKNRKLTDGKRKFKVSKLSSLYLFAEGNAHPHLDLATCTWTDCVGHSFSKYCCVYSVLAL